VQIRIDKPAVEGQQLRLPVWIPGSYLIREFAQHIQAVSASSSNGRTVATTKINKSTWQCAPCDEELIINYQVYAFDRSVRSAYLDNTRAFFNGSSVFLAIVGQEDQACSLHIEKIDTNFSNAWKVACTYPVIDVDAQAFGDYAAINYDQLIDHPVEISELSEVSFKVDSKPHRMVFTGSHRGDLTRLASDMDKICNTHVQMFGELPLKEYLFMTLVGADIYGGLEHRDSTALMCSQHELPQKHIKRSDSKEDNKKVSDAYRRFLGLCSHEYFHLWNVKRIKPLAYHENNLSDEAYTRQLWIFEGITSYYDDLALVRAGVITAKSYLELISATLNRVRNQAGRLKQSLADSSYDTWIKFYRQNENSPNSIVSYYAKGSLAALALDITLQTKTEGRFCLDDVMRTLWQEYGKNERGLPEGVFEEICERLSGLNLSSFFNNWIRGTGDQPITSLLLGMGIKTSTQLDKSQQKLTVHFGCDVQMQGPAIMVKTVHSGSSAENAGLAAGDQLLAFAGIKISRKSLQTLYQQYHVGDTGELLVFRQDRLLRLHIELAEPSRQKWKLEIDNTADHKTQALRDKWLWQ